MADPKDIREIIKKTAELARLSFPEGELATYTQKVDSVLKYVEQLRQLDTEKIEPMSHAMEVKGTLREDVNQKSPDTDDIIASAPERDGRFYQVPRVIE